MHRERVARTLLLLGLGLSVRQQAQAEPVKTELDQELDRVTQRPAPTEENPVQAAEPVIPIVGYRHEVDKVTPAWLIALGLGSVVFVVTGAGSLLVLRSTNREPEPEPTPPPSGETIG